MRIDKVTTKTGDQGQTSVADGIRISKDCDLIQAIGEIDELNSSLGFLINFLPEDLNKNIIFKIQHILFNAGSELAIPKSSGFSSQSPITPENISSIELEIDLITQELPPLKEFILPGGTLAASACHVSRSICRRAERALVRLSKHTEINPFLLIYFNRLSDFLCVFARALNLTAQKPEIFWRD